MGIAFPKPYHTVLTESCETLPGVGPAIAKKLAKCGVYTIQDALFYLPFRYQDRTRITPIQDVRANEWCVIAGRVSKVAIKRGKRLMLDCHVEDKTGFIILRFFHFNPALVKKLSENSLIRAFGEIKAFSSQLEMIHPEYQLLEQEDGCPVNETLTPIYSTTQGLSQTRLRQIMALAFKTFGTHLPSLEWMSEDKLQQYGLHSIPAALNFLHNPPPDACIQAIEEGTHPAVKRLALDELLAQRLSMQFARQERATFNAKAMPSCKEIENQFLMQLPFKLTNAQKRVVAEISADLSQAKPMLRLVQGDVGAGKTVVAAMAALQVIANGMQVAFMAPTDILSEQHANNLTPLLANLGITVQRLSGKMKSKERKAVLQAVANGDCQLVIGTHALFQAEVSFAQLGLAIIDEQHRFGVAQRLTLQQKGQSESATPHQLLMTATPIPRTLTMTHLAHMDLSVLDERPPGRTPVVTAVLQQEKRTLLINRLSSVVKEGRQAYWVCTLIEESEKLQCMAATETAERLQAHLPSVRIGLVHGRMKALEKEATMAAFKRGEIDLLVATTVIEVGVDVANASLMIIENAERLGLSQLHQLRGRVGRGSEKAHCILLYQPPISAQGLERLRIMRTTTDGFVIAEKDLELRGAGEVLGTRQTGYHSLRIASLPRDQDLLSLLPSLAKELVNNTPETAKLITRRWLGDYESFLLG